MDKNCFGNCNNCFKCYSGYTSFKFCLLLLQTIVKCCSLSGLLSGRNDKLVRVAVVVGVIRKVKLCGGWCCQGDWDDRGGQTVGSLIKVVTLKLLAD